MANLGARLALMAAVAIVLTTLAGTAAAAERTMPPGAADEICEFGSRIDDNGARGK